MPQQRHTEGILFPGHFILRFGNISWLPRSSDLSAPDFFLLGYLKAKVYATRVRSFEELTGRTKIEIKNIIPEMLLHVMQNV